MLNSLAFDFPFDFTAIIARPPALDLTPPESPTKPRATPGELEALIERAAFGDEDALAAFYDRTKGYAFGLILRILGDAATAEEVLLDVYMQAWRQARSFDAGRGGALAWLTTMARSRAIDRLRSGKSQRHCEVELEAAHDISHEANVEEDAVAAELRGIVRAALDELPHEQREVVELAYYGGFSHSEIVSRLGLPLGTVKSRIRLGMMRLRESLGSMSGLL